MRDDGLPTLPTGEPVLARWFVLAMLVLVPAAIGVTIWGLASIPDDDPLPAAERRPAGDGEVTVERGQAQLNPVDEVAAGPGCAEAIRVTGDEGARAAAHRALEATCELFRGERLPEAREGLRVWVASGGELRFATFQLAGVESSARREDDHLVVELNAAFQFADAARAAPAIVHQLVLLADPTWPGETVTAERALLAARLEQEACQVLDHPEPPRGCRDVAELLAADDPLGDLVGAGYRPAGDRTDAEHEEP